MRVPLISTETLAGEPSFDQTIHRANRLQRRGDRRSLAIHSHQRTLHRKTQATQATNRARQPVVSEGSDMCR